MFKLTSFICFFKQRPRKVGARFTGTDIAPDEFEQPTLSFDWDAKRDRWNGYDLVDHKKVVDEFRKIEEVKISYALDPFVTNPIYIQDL